MQNDVTMYNGQVKKNRVTLCRFIDAVCYLANQELQFQGHDELSTSLTLRLLMSYIYGAPSKARNANVVYIWTYVWQR